MNEPTEIFNGYFLQSEYLKSRGDLEGFNSNTFTNDIRRITMGSCKIYDSLTNQAIGEATIVLTHVTSIVPGVANFLTQSQVNIFDKCIIPNMTSGYIEYQNGGTDKVNPYNNSTQVFPENSVTQDWFGNKVIVTHLANISNPNRFQYQIQVYK